MIKKNLTTKNEQKSQLFKRDEHVFFKPASWNIHSSGVQVDNQHDAGDSGLPKPKSI